MLGPLVLAADARYAMQLATALRSIVEANRSAWPLDVYVLSDGFSEDLRRRVLESLCKDSAAIRWTPVDLAVFQGYGTLEYISRMTFARLLIPRILPDTVSRVLYLDADILVLDHLAPLWDANLEGKVLGAVCDYGLDRQLKNPKPGLPTLPSVRDYFNAGVLLIDLDRWRAQQISERALAYLAANPHSAYADQDALNVICDGAWKPLDQRWNFQNHYSTRIQEMHAPQRPAVVHFVTDLKPWKPSSSSVNASFYNSFRSRTQFCRTYPEKLWNIVQVVWYWSKRILRRSAGLRAIWNYFKVRAAGTARS